MSVQLNCPHCGGNLALPKAPAGATLRCPLCQQTFTLPVAAAPTPAAQTPPSSPVAKAASQPAARVPTPAVARPAVMRAANVPAARNRRTQPGRASESTASNKGLWMLGGLALAAVALLMLGVLAMVFWKNLFTESPLADRPAPAPGAVAQGPSETSQVEPPTPQPLEPKDKPAPPPVDVPTVKKDSTVPDRRDDVDVADLGKPDKPTPTPPVIAEKPNPPPDKPNPPPDKPNPPPDKPNPPPDKPNPPPDKEKPRPGPEVTVTIPGTPAVPGVDAARIADAIDKGVKYLKAQQRPDGAWMPPGGTGYAIGYTAMACLALLECDVPATDPAVKKALMIARTHANQLGSVYDISTAILMLERAGDARDRPLIQKLAARLLAGQSFDGAWIYDAEPLDPAVEQQMLTALRTQWPWSPAQPRPAGALTGKDAPAKLKLPRIDLAKLPPDVVKWNRWRTRPAPGAGDHSNTQFATLALWAARRHGIPAECAVLATYQHFVAGQQADGGWPYTIGNSTPSMTCAGLLGLAVGHGALPPAAIGEDNAKLESPQIDRALEYLSNAVGTPATDARARPPVPNLYLLWSIERVAMLYDLKTIGGKDWYGWGAQALLANQFPDGHFSGGGYQGSSAHLDTSFALLFLKRSNLVADLTENLRLHMVIRDPGAK
jgi:hypothetical protein